jgi:hypothetical protein
MMWLGKGKRQLTDADMDKMLQNYLDAAREATSEKYTRLYSDYNRGVWSTEAQRYAEGRLNEAEAKLLETRNPRLAQELRDRGLVSGNAASLERLTGAHQVTDAMRRAFDEWQSVAVAEHGIGAPSPQVAIERMGQGTILPRVQNLDKPIIPNMQFWDLVKRDLDKQIARALGPNKDGDARTLVMLKNQLTGELDRITNGAYAAAREGAAGKFKAIDTDLGASNMMEAGEKYVDLGERANNREIDKQVRALLDNSTEPERQLFKLGFVRRFIERIENIPEKEDVLSKVFVGAEGKGQQSARNRIRMALGPEGGKAGGQATADYNKLQAILRLEAMMDRYRQAQGNSITGRLFYRYGNEAVLGTAGLAFATEGHLDSNPERGWLSRYGPVAASMLALFAAHKGKEFDQNVARLIVEKLLSGRPEAKEQAVNMVANSKTIMDALAEGQGRFARWLATHAPQAAQAGSAPQGTPLQQQGAPQ